MYDKLDMVAHDYNLGCGDTMLGILPESAGHLIDLTPETVVCLPYVCTQICVSITHTRALTHT